MGCFDRGVLSRAELMVIVKSMVGLVSTSPQMII
jgi:hypothetical protein